MRRLVFAVAAVAGAALLWAAMSQAALVNITVEDDEFIPPNASFGFLEVDNPNVVWEWGVLGGGTNRDHNVVQKRGMFRSGNPKDEGEYELQASAGKYQYFCEVHRSDGMRGKVSIIPAIDDVTADSARVIWAFPSTTTGKRFDVRYRVNGGSWELWKRQTKKHSAIFGGPEDKPVAFETATNTYEFSARSQKGKPAKRKRSGWSPPLSVGGPDR
jgi:hypothetical protein